MENLLKMDDLGVLPCLETPIYDLSIGFGENVVEERQSTRFVDRCIQI